METEGTKSISEYLKEAEDKGLTVVIIGADSEDGKHVKLAKFIIDNPEKFMVIPLDNLSNDDKVKLEAVNKKEDPFGNPPIPFKNYAPEPLPDIKLITDSHKTKHFAGFPNKKLKDYQKNKKR